jgi:hypothetical protein
MLHKLSTVSIVAFLGLSVIFCGSKKQQTGSNHTWAGVTFNHALYTEGWTNDMVIEFAVFNDGNAPVAANPCIDRSTLLINGAQLTGKDLEWFSFNLVNGPRSPDPLPAGNGTGVSKGGFGQLFQKPGVYTVIWKSDCFESQPVFFRVMPRHDK